MKNSKTRTIQFRRKRKGKTDYKARLALLKSGKPRLVIRKSLKNIQAQIVVYEEKGDKVLFSAHSNELRKLGWKMCTNNIMSAYVIGMLIAQKAKKNKIAEAVVDIGLQAPVKGSRLYAVVKGAIDNGLNVPCSKKVLPTEERVSGKHVEDYAGKLVENEAAFKKQFSKYLKDGMNPKDASKYLGNIKNKVIGA